MVSDVMSFKVVGIFKRAKRNHSVGGAHMSRSAPFAGAPHKRLETWGEERLCFQLRGSTCTINGGRKVKRSQLCGDFLTSHHEFPEACKAWAHRMGRSWDVGGLGRDS